MATAAPLKALAPKPSHKSPAPHPTVTASKTVAKAAPLPSFARSSPKAAESTTAARATAPLSTLPARAPAASSGQPIAPHVQEALERSFAVDMGAIRVHTDASAHSTNKSLQARAYAFGSDIFLGHGEDAADLGLIAHEAAHVIQQQGLDARHAEAAPQRWSNERGDRFEREADRASAAVQRGERFTVSERVGTHQVQRLGLSDVLDYFADKAANIPGYTLFTVILGVNPINMDHVERSPANLLRGVIELVPGGHLLTEALKNSGVFEKAGDWVAEQFHKLGMVGASIRDALTSFRWRDLLHPSELWHKAKRIITDPIDKILSLVGNLVKDLIHFIKEAILKPVAKLAEGKPAYTLMRGVLGSDPISGEPVADQGSELLGGLMKLAGQEEAWENAKKANAIPRILSWFKKAMSELIGFVRDIPGMVIGAIKSLELTDLIAFPLALAKVAKVFGSFVLKFIEWGVRSVWHLLEIVFDVVSPGAFGYIKKTGAALKDILKHPIHFVRNLVSAAIHGFKNFASNIGTHLKTGLIDWLTGSLTGVYIPKALTLSEMGLFALSVLDLTWAQIRAKIVKALGANGETIMKGLETGFDVVVALVKGGTAAAWDLIKEKLTDLKDTVVDGIKGFVVDSIVKKAIPKLIAMFIPGAGFISAIISIYDTVKVFIDKLAKIVATVKAFLDSIVSIAEGRLEAAEKRVEDSLAGILTLAINFLAGFLGLGKITDKIREILAKIRGTVDKALDAGVTFLIGKAKTALAWLWGSTGKKGEQKNDGAPKSDLEADTEFSIGSEKHEIRLVSKSGQAQLVMSSELLDQFSAHLERIKKEWVPLRADSPVGNLASELDTLSADGQALVLAAVKISDPRAQSLALNQRVNALAARLKAICQRFNIPRIEGLGSYQRPPPHRVSYQGLDGYDRARGMSATLSFNSRSFMRATAGAAGVKVAGTSIAGYQGGHLLAASLGGANGDARNYAAMSSGTNTSRGGIFNFEDALRTALRQDVFPPWIVRYGIQPVYTGDVGTLQAALDSLVGSQPGAARILFSMAQRNLEVDADSLVKVFPKVPEQQVRRAAGEIRHQLLLNFVPRRFGVDLQIEQAPEGGRLPAAQPFDNHL